MIDKIRIITTSGLFLVAAVLGSCVNVPSQAKKIADGTAPKLENVAPRCAGTNTGLTQTANAETQTSRYKLEKAESLSVDELFSRVAVGRSAHHVSSRDLQPTRSRIHRCNSQAGHQFGNPSLLRS